MERIVCFHSPDEENGYLSNWYHSSFVEDGVTYSSMEQYMMYKKALTFGDTDAAEKILSTDDVALIKKYGREAKGYDDHVWSGIREIVVYNGLCLKFSQNKELLDSLLSTGDAFLAECAVHDRIWGIGLSMTDSARLDRRQWRGTNLLGYSLMMVRETLSKEM